MFVRLALLLMLFWVGGCTKGDDVYVGTFEQCLREARLEKIVKLDDRKSLLSLKLFRGSRGQLRGEMRLDGEVRILGFSIHSYGYIPFPIEDLELEEEELKGRVNVPDFPMKARFKGKFNQDHSKLNVDVRYVGEAVLERVEEEVDENEGSEGTVGEKEVVCSGQESVVS